MPRAPYQSTSYAPVSRLRREKGQRGGSFPSFACRRLPLRANSLRWLLTRSLYRALFWWWREGCVCNTVGEEPDLGLPMVSWCRSMMKLKQTHSFTCIYMFAPLGPSGSALAAAVCAAAAPASMKLIAPDALWLGRLLARRRSFLCLLLLVRLCNGLTPCRPFGLSCGRDRHAPRRDYEWGRRFSDVQMIDDLFYEMDCDHSGSLNVDEIYTYLQTLHKRRPSSFPKPKARRMRGGRYA